MAFTSMVNMWGLEKKWSFLCGRNWSRGVGFRYRVIWGRDCRFKRWGNQGSWWCWIER